MRKGQITISVFIVSVLVLIAIVFVKGNVEDVPCDDNNEFVNQEAINKTAEKINTGIPVLEITTEKEIWEFDSWTTAKFEFTEEKEVYKCEVKKHGNSTALFNKTPFAIRFVKEEKISDIGQGQNWILLANYADKTLIRNDYVFDIGNNIFTNLVWTPKGMYVELVINNYHMGNYYLVEHIDISENRVNIQNIMNIDDDINKDGCLDLSDGGFIVEADTKSKTDEYNFTTENGGQFTIKDPSEFSDSVKEHITDYINEFDRILYSSGFKDKNEGYNKYINIDSFVDWYLINEFTKNNDSTFFSSVYLYYNPNDGKLYMGPIWDFDLACGNTSFNDNDLPDGFYIKNSLWISRMFEDEHFVNKVVNRWNEIKSELLNTIDQVPERADYLRKSATGNFEEWPILGQDTMASARGFEERTTYQSEVDYLQNWLYDRYYWLDDAFNSLIEE